MSYSDKRLFVFGEILYDVYDKEEKLGGAPFNVAFNLHMQGLSPCFISKVGDDKLGTRIFDFFERNNISADYLRKDSNFGTGRVLVKISDGEPDYEILKDQAYDRIDFEMPDIVGKFIYYGTLAARYGVSRASLLGLLNCDAGGRFYDVNLRKDCWDTETVMLLASHADYMKVNAEELDTIAEIVCPDEVDYVSKARCMINLFRLRSLYVTFGEKGAACITSDADYRSRSYPVTDLKDTVGAGDAFSSVIIKGLMEGADIQETLNRAAHYASKICGLKGALTENRDFYREITEEYNAVI